MFSVELVNPDFVQLCTDVRHADIKASSETPKHQEGLLTCGAWFFWHFWTSGIWNFAFNCPFILESQKLPVSGTGNAFQKVSNVQRSVL